MTQIVKASRRIVHRITARFVALILRKGAIYDPENFRLWENHGYHITPTHFYCPIPDTRELEKVYPNRKETPGIDYRPEFQLRLLSEKLSQFSAEYNSFPISSTEENQFYLDNDAFGGVDPHVYYSMIRCFQPRLIIEIGSGYSTLLGVQASQANGTTQLRFVDPWPRKFIAKGAISAEHIRLRVEELEHGFFQELQENDILFIDSSHVIRTGGDVTYLFLQVLPRLASGVIVHVHDVYLPFDYPKKLVVEQHMFWTEQYLLQAYLIENRNAEVMFGSNYMAHEYPEALKASFPRALWWGGGSFWIRKC